MDTDDPVDPLYGTLPQAARRFGIGSKRLRRRAAEGCFPIYACGGTWVRVKFAEVEAWLRSTRVAVSGRGRRPESRDADRGNADHVGQS